MYRIPKSNKVFFAYSAIEYEMLMHSAFTDAAITKYLCVSCIRRSSRIKAHIPWLRSYRVQRANTFKRLITNEVQISRVFIVGIFLGTTYSRLRSLDTAEARVAYKNATAKRVQPVSVVPWFVDKRTPKTLRLKTTREKRKRKRRRKNARTDVNYDISSIERLASETD